MRTFGSLCVALIVGLLVVPGCAEQAGTATQKNEVKAKVKGKDSDKARTAQTIDFDADSKPVPGLNIRKAGK